MRNAEHKNAAIYLLKQEVEEIFGRPINSYRDCLLLSEEVYAKTSFKINQNTLRRFFGLVKATYPPSAATQNILSRFCGFESMEELMHTKEKKSGVGELEKAGAILNYFVSVFRNTPVKDANDTTFMALVKHTILFLQDHPELTSKLQKEIAKTRNGQEYYFEQFVDIDHLHSFYGEGLRYYLNEKKTTEAHIFGHSLLCQRGWLMGQVENVKKHFEEVYKKKLSKAIHPFVCGRYFAAHLFYSDVMGLSTERILVDAQHLHSSLKPTDDNYRLFPAFEYILSIALVLTRHHAEALYYLDYAAKHYPTKHDYQDEGYYQTLAILKGIALVRTGKAKEARRIYENLRPSRFYFMTRKTNTILYLVLVRALGLLHEKTEAQLARLVAETGYTSLLTI